MRCLSSKIKVLRANYKNIFKNAIRLHSGCRDPGGAGSIREAGGAFRDMGIAKESQYFYKKEKELLKKIKESMKDQKEFHEEQIALHKSAIEKIESKQRSMD
ncbi:ATPase inhibitor mai-2, mitochondrial-like [Spodoptera litura]|uniref:ATPase inhibitor mai-2, mitochondrial-like n=1 Tax=Spodoptera litura TaxID=69820 RepID=A0A9J7IWM3_SPOLT|nr:ATPase inhibitor mai-2, mitochondrial-like [Spodoptera litura]